MVSVRGRLKAHFPAAAALAGWAKWEAASFLRRPDAEASLYYLLARFGGRVAGGPFRGMRYLGDSVGSSACPKVLGTYEIELADAVEDLARVRYDRILNVGCAEGFYAVGIAVRTRHSPETIIHAYDTEPQGRVLTGRLAEANGVADRVVVGGLCDHAELGRHAGLRVAVVCDIEGAEADLLDPDKAPALRGYDIVVEVHDGPAEGPIAGLLRGRFAGSHDIRAVAARPRTPADFPARRLLLSPRWRRAALDEHRRLGMRWLVLTARRPSGRAPDPAANGADR